VPNERAERGIQQFSTTKFIKTVENDTFLAQKGIGIANAGVWKFLKERF